MKRIIGVIALSAALALVSGPAIAATQVGQVDSQFGTNGIAEVPAGLGDGARGVVEQSTGKIVVSGFLLTAAHGWDIVATRYTQGGQRDLSFGTNGIANFDVSGRHDVPRGMAVLADDKILIGGDVEWANTPANYRIIVMRLLPDGALDPTFGVGGILTDTGAQKTAFAAMDVLPDGSILVTGTLSGTSNGFLRKYASNGVLDTSFGSAGTVVTTGYQLRSIAHDAFGNIVGLAQRPVSGTPGIGIVRFTTSGSLDTSFGSSGWTTISIGAGAADPKKLLLTADRIRVAGTAIDLAGEHVASLTQFTLSGTLDTAFGANGSALWHRGSGNNDYGLSATLAGDGSTFVVGYTQDASATKRALAIRIDSSGQAVGSWGTSGGVIGMDGWYETANVSTTGALLAGGGHEFATTSSIALQRLITVEYETFLVQRASESRTGIALASTGSEVFPGMLFACLLAAAGILMARRSPQPASTTQ